MRVPRILIVGPAWVGDMVMAQVLFKTLKQKIACTIDVLAPEWSRPLTDRMPEVSRSISMTIGHGQLQWEKRVVIGQALRNQYDEAYVLPNSWKSALIPLFAKIPKRIGWLGEMRVGLLNDFRRLDKKKYPRMIDRFAALAYPVTATMPALPTPQLMIQTNNVDIALKQYSLNTNSSKILALCPGAEFGPSKRWPEHYYAKIAEKALEQGCEVWIFGSVKDMPVAKMIQTFCRDRCHDLTGRTTLSEAIDLLSLASCVVTNDSGLMHIAAALNRPLIALYGSSDPSFTPPLSKQAQILRAVIDCSPCFQRNCPLGHQRCMQELTPDKVWVHLQQVLQCEF
jgi:heptosyltransferase II